MDLNNLYFQHQISLMRASSADCRKAQALHQADAEGIACRIGRFQRRAGAGAAMAWSALCLAGRDSLPQKNSFNGAAQ